VVAVHDSRDAQPDATSLATDIRPPSVEQVRLLLDVIRHDDDDFYEFIHLAVVTGARRRQLLALRRADIDFDHAALRFTRAVVEGPDGPVLGPTKNRRTRRVAVDQTGLDVLATPSTEPGPTGTQRFR
jgi:integrase